MEHIHTDVADAVVIGSGHNGMVAACHLAAAGLRVEVLESDDVLGGAVSTVERWPGVLVDRGSSAHVIIRHSGVVEELGLADHGLTYIDCDPWGFAPATVPGDPGPDGRPLVFSVDLDATCASIAAACGPADAAAYRRFVGVWGPRSAHVVRAFGDRPSPGRLARHLWPLGAPQKGQERTAGAELATDFLGSGDALLDRWFSSERLKAALSWFGAQSGPPMHEPGTAAMVGWVALLHTTPPGHPVGGSGGLTQALRRKLESHGGRVILGDGAARLLVDDGRVTGVRTASGRRVEAPVVVAACHVLATRDIAGEHAPPALADAAPPLGNGFGLVVRCLTDALPAYPGVDPDDALQGLQLLCTDRAQLASAHGDWLAGLLPRDPVPLAMSFSASDPTLAPEGRYVVTIWGQWYPYQLADGSDWDDLAQPAARQLVDAVDRYAPGFAASVLDTYVQTPLQLERELSLPRGNVMHVEMSLASMFAFRPTPALSGHRVPGLDGLYLAGASTHPGGGVSGNSGRTAARIVLADRAPAARARRAVSAGLSAGLSALRRR
ncbi:NAD(P)-binding protein [Modestobacter sp. I12A-02628]|uniref:Pyridine nucleotide-disulfide oxidoreductase domain-containing protein 2 n=1 Tax=Goekera deserti TaxID=2497753 RepID=A0A7K3WAF7_9ACTN|nr:NAD(P)-binding protein [Goekera deserti]NDI47634.1 NAD(P)-binding protein [Goekera deserti]NDI47697.1 NAD(P)-binding protein [Goekera deserti]NEL53445.1 NAD(P)/FAD-dependent oxidoreductase [Goekera deserti]